MIGYKAFLLNSDGVLISKYSCSNKITYIVGETYEETNAVLYEEGFHFCKHVHDVYNYYPYNSVVCQITASGHIVSDGAVFVTTSMKIEHFLNGLMDGKVWYKDGLLHSNEEEDLPALEHPLGWCRRWYRNGLLHRANGLHAMEYFNGTKAWYKDGVLHRDNDLPAIEDVNGAKKWYKNGILYHELLPSIDDDDDGELCHYNLRARKRRDILGSQKFGSLFQKK